MALLQSSSSFPNGLNTGGNVSFLIKKEALLL